LSEDETVIFDVLPDDLKVKLSELNSRLEYAIHKHMKPSQSIDLGYLKYPLKKHRDAIDAITATMMPEYEDFVKKDLTPRVEDIRSRIQEFYRRHMHGEDDGNSVNPNLSDAYLLDRFKPKINFAPFKLDTPFMFEAVSQDEKREFESQVRHQIEREAREEINERTAELFKAFQDALTKLNNGKMVTQTQVKRLQRLRGEVYDALSVAEKADEYHETFDLAVKIVETLSNKQSRYSQVDSKDTKKAIILETVEAAKRIAAEGKPKVDEFKELVMETVQTREASKPEDLHLKKLVGELQFE
jgi:hypothetical protein